jgi:hypothetical protein
MMGFVFAILFVAVFIRLAWLALCKWEDVVETPQERQSSDARYMDFRDYARKYPKDHHVHFGNGHCEVCGIRWE